MRYFFSEILTAFVFYKNYILKSIMSGKRSFNQYLWNIGKQIEDELLPKINTAFVLIFWLTARKNNY